MPSSASLVAFGVVKALGAGYLIYLGIRTLAALAGRLRQWLGGGAMRGPLPRYATGGLYIGLGVSTALTGRRQ